MARSRVDITIEQPPIRRHGAMVVGPVCFDNARSKMVEAKPSGRFAMSHVSVSTSGYRVENRLWLSLLVGAEDSYESVFTTASVPWASIRGRGELTCRLAYPVLMRTTQSVRVTLHLREERWDRRLLSLPKFFWRRARAAWADHHQAPIATVLIEGIVVIE